MNTIEKVFAQAITWAFSGALYGGFFIGLWEYLWLQRLEAWQIYLFSSVLSGLVIAAFFGSMLVALGGTLAGILTAISYQILFSTYHSLGMLLGIAFVVGLIAGSFFTKREIHDAQPMAQAAAGALAGLLAGPLAWLVGVFFNWTASPMALAGFSVAFVGLFYVIFIRYTPRLCNHIQAQKIGGLMVSSIIAMAVAAVFWVIGESSMSLPELGQESIYQDLLENAPLGLMGGAIGGAVGGALLEVLGVNVEEHIQ